MPLDGHLGQLPLQAYTLSWGLKPSKFFPICQGEEKFIALFSNDVLEMTSYFGVILSILTPSKSS